MRWAKIILSVALSQPAPASSQPDFTNRVDALFSRYNDQSPGCVLGILNAGHLTYSRAYGMANLEVGVPLKTESIFSIASMSKQFTGMAIVLLVEDGKLALTDDIRKYLPELPSYQHVITISDLLHHTSGLKDLDQLLQFSGIHLPFDLMSRSMAWSLVRRQRDLNFVPGDEYSYSDTNYFLLGEIVERVSGETLAKFAKSRIFDPLGMTHTEFRTDASEVIHGQAAGYRKLSDGLHLAPDDDEVLGDSGVFTTIEDLARWDRNFFEPTVGGQEGLGLMLARRPLNDGSANVYAVGLKVQIHRGLRMIEHAGDLPGYQSELIRFPDQRLSVAVLCNQRDDGDATSLALGVAHIVLEKEFATARTTIAPLPRPDSKPVTAVPGEIGRDAGIFWDEDTGDALTFAVLGGNLSIVEPSDAEVGPLERRGSNHFYRDGVTYDFSDDGSRMEARSSAAGHPNWFLRVPKPANDPAALRNLAGAYYSADIDRTWRLSIDRNVLVLHREGFADEILTTPRFRDAFDSDLALLHFTRSARGRVNGFDALNYRLRRIHFQRLQEK
ncbi:MAG TPA: serine hydrolase domain-containing protein [Allosphingosinicella sp.]|jgi:CubicO group peptidase (beta-lactamase class C family)